jgi:HlyD family secretion protein
MTATVSIITGEARNILRVPNSALRYSPPPEKLMAFYKEMFDKFQAQQGKTPGPRQGSPSPQGQNPRGFQGFQTGGGADQSAWKKKFGQVWMEDENGKLTTVMFKKGVSDNTYTEIEKVFRGELKEGQEVIVGETTGDSENKNSSSSFRGMRRTMRFMRR